MSVLQESQWLTIKIYLYMPTFRLMVTMVADFCSLVIHIARGDNDQ